MQFLNYLLERTKRRLYVTEWEVHENTGEVQKGKILTLLIDNLRFFLFEECDGRII